MKLLAIVLLLICTSALAATSTTATNGYDLTMNLSINGKHIASPRVITEAGEAATVTQKTETEESFIEVVAAEGEIQNNKGILMNFIVGTINKKGERTILAKPQILAQENELAQITVGDKKETLSLSVLAKRKAL